MVNGELQNLVNRCLAQGMDAERIDHLGIVLTGGAFLSGFREEPAAKVVEGTIEIIRTWREIVATAEAQAHRSQTDAQVLWADMTRRLLTVYASNLYRYLDRRAEDLWNAPGHLHHYSAYLRAGGDPEQYARVFALSLMVDTFRYVIPVYSGVEGGISSGGGYVPPPKLIP